jgi:hypothetical protein
MGFLVKLFVGVVAVLGITTVAGAFFTSHGAGIGSAKVEIGSLDYIKINPTSTSVVVGQPASYTVTAFGNFGDSTNVTSSAILNISTGTCSTTTSSCTSTTVGSQTVTANYEGKTAQATQVVNQAATTTSIVSTTGSPSVVGQAVIYTATVSVTTPGSGIPTGNVEFLDGGAAIPDCSGSSGNPLTGTSATCTVTYSSTGSHTITAEYLGDTNYLGSLVSPPVTQVVNQAATTTTVSTDLTTYVSGEPIVVTAVVAPVAPGAGTPTGTVSISDGASSPTTCTINLATGSSCTIVETTPGSYTMTGTYSGNSNFLGSSGGAPAVTVNTDSTKTVITNNASTPVTGASFTFTATVSASPPGTGTPAGTVTWTVTDPHGTPVVCSDTTLSGGVVTCTITNAIAGTYSASAQFTDTDGDFANSSSNTNTVSVSRATSTTATSTNLSTYVSGQSIVVTATVAPVAPGTGTPTGTVSVSDGASSPTTCTINLATSSSCTIVETTPGSYTMSGTYSGDSNFLGSSGSAAAVVVSTDGTTTVVTNNASSPVAGASFTFTATVSAATPGSGTPAGTVAWTVTDPHGTPVVCSDTTLSGGAVTCTITNAIVGTYSASAQFTDTDGDFVNSNSLTNTVSVSKATSTTVTITQISPATQTVTTTGEGAVASSITTNDTLGPVTFTASSDNGLSVNTSGQITVTGTLAKGTYVVSGSTSDAFGDAGTYSFTLTVNPAGITQISPATQTVTTTGEGAVASSITTNDTLGPVTFTASSDNGLSVNTSGQITVTGTLAKGTYVVSGSTSDAFGDAGTYSFTLTVNPAGITQISPFSNSTTTSASSTFTDQLNPTSQDGSPVAYVTVVTNASLNISSSGKITVVGGPLKVGIYAVSGTDSDALGETGIWSYTLTVTKGLITQSAPTTGTITSTGSAGFTSQLIVSGATGTTTFVVTAPNSNLSISSSGKITVVGGPLKAGSYTVSGTVTDSLGDTGTWTFTLTVTCASKGTSSLKLSPEYPSPVTVGASATYTALVQSISGKGALTGTVSFFENGVAVSNCQSLNLASNAARCTMSFPSAGSVTVTATYANDGSFTGSSDSSVQVVNQGTTSLTLSPSSPVNVGSKVTFTATIAETSGSAALSGSVTFTENGTAIGACTDLALSANAASCAVTFASAGTFTLGANYGGDPNFQGSSNSLSQLVNSSLSITTTSLANATNGESGYFQTLLGTGGTGPYVWSISSGVLPKGLTLNATTGVISGTVSGSATSETFTVKLTDAKNASTTKQFTIDVNCKPVFTCSNSGHAYEGQWFSFQVTTSGWSDQSYSWSGHLPGGVTFNSATGVFSGTPDSGSHGTYGFTFTAANPYGSTSQYFTLNVAGSPHGSGH